MLAQETKFPALILPLAAMFLTKLCYNSTILFN
uniref:Uncharacterized protein n=1 Tax=viral metagenome TaxID=1070528 RepID=A0A6C0M0X4_9ZZZZ